MGTFYTWIEQREKLEKKTMKNLFCSLSLLDFEKKTVKICWGWKNEGKNRIKKRKYFDYFIDASIQYVKFKIGNIYPDPYNSSNDYHTADGALVKYKSLINTYGFGALLNFQDRINIYGAIGSGINYWEQKVVVNYSWNDIKNGWYTGLIYYARFGITLKFFNKYQSSCAGFPPKGIIVK